MTKEEVLKTIAEHLTVTVEKDIIYSYGDVDTYMEVKLWINGIMISSDSVRIPTE